jgi:hypothetical protein
VEKIRDQGYMNYAILEVYAKCQHEERIVNAPTKGDMDLFSRKIRSPRGDNKRLSKCWKRRLLYDYQINKE